MMLGLWERLNFMSRKPKGFGKFSELLRKVASVPKEHVDDKIAADKAAKKKRRKK